MTDDIFDLVLNIDSTEEDRQEVRLVREEGASDSATLEWPTDGDEKFDAIWPTPDGVEFGDYTAEVVAEGQDISRSQTVTVAPPFEAAYAVAHTLAGPNDEVGARVYDRDTNEIEYEKTLSPTYSANDSYIDSDFLFVCDRQDPGVVYANPTYDKTSTGQFTEANGVVTAVESAVSNGSGLVAYGSEDTNAYIQEITDPSASVTLSGPSNTVSAIDFSLQSGSSDLFVVASEDGNIYIYDLSGPSLSQTISDGSGPFFTASATSRFITAGDFTDTVYVWDNANPPFSLEYTFTASVGNATTSDIIEIKSEYGETIGAYAVHGTDAGNCLVWDVIDGTLEYQFGQREISTVAGVFVDTETVVYAGEVGVIAEHRLSDGTLINKFDTGETIREIDAF